MRQFVLPALLFLVTANAASNTTVVSGPFLQNSSDSTGWIIGNDLWNITIGEVYGKDLYFKDRNLIGDAVGHYAGYDGENNFVWTSASIHTRTSEYLDVVFSSTLVDLHWVIFPELSGAYQYVVNKALPELGVLRTLFRLDNTTFTYGRTNIKDSLLPPYAEILAATKVQDETWQRADGSYITKYDFSAFVRGIDFHGVYGEEFGSWYIRPGRDYINGNHLKQELTVHRESSTGDAVELNVVHGSHFQVTSKATFSVGKTWGPWLWYLNDGSRDDAKERAALEFSSWPYSWFNSSAYQSRGAVSGKLTLSDGRPAIGAAVFLGDAASNTSTLDQGTDYYYTTYADDEGAFSFEHVRSGNYGLSAWSNGGEIGNVTTSFSLSKISVGSNQTVDIGNQIWEEPQRERIFQIGELDRKSLGFRNGGAPYQHGLTTKSPANLTYTVGSSNVSDWYYAQSSIGSWTIAFDLSETPVSAAILGVSLAGYSKSSDLVITVNGHQVATFLTANLSSDPALYRSGTTAGEWRFYEFDIASDYLQKGKNNIVFQITRFTLWRGYLWDSIYLDWNSEKAI